MLNFLLYLFLTEPSYIIILYFVFENKYYNYNYNIIRLQR